MKRIIAFILAVFIALWAYSQSVSYNHQLLRSDGCKVTLSVVKQDTSFYILATVKSESLKFLASPVMKLKNFEGEVLRLQGVALGNSSESYGFLVGSVVIPATEVSSTAQFLITPEQFELIKNGVAKIRLTTTPIVHEKTFKKDKFGKKLYEFYKKIKYEEDDDF